MDIIDMDGHAVVTLGVRTPDGCRELERGWLPPAGANRAYRERQKAVLVGPPGVDCRLLIDDEEIPPSGTVGDVPPDDHGSGGIGSRGTASDGLGSGSGTVWTWTPNFYAGSVRVELLDPSDRILGTWWLDVSPDPKKIGREIFGRMVEEIVEFDERLLVGDEPARRRLGAVGHSDDPHVLFERLRRRADDLERALAAIQREPASMPRPRRQRVPFRAVRRADLRTVRVAAQDAAALAAIRKAPSHQPAFTVGGWHAEPHFDVRQVERRLDAPVNRCALYLLRGIRRRCRYLSLRFEQLASDGVSSETRTALQGRLERRRTILAGIERRMETAERRPPFAETRRAELTAAGLTAVAAHPLYARFWGVGWEALRRGASLLDPKDPLPLSPSWEVYEHWCFVEVSRLLRQWLPDWNWSVSNARGGSRLSFRVKGRKEDRSIAVYLQKRAPSSNGRERPGLWSVSRELRPDLVVRWERGEQRGFVVLDAKYRTGRDSVLRGMAESAHLYRDALRWGSDRSGGSLLLVPRVRREVEWLADETYVARHCVGAVALRVGCTPPPWLRGLLLGEA